MNEHAPLDALKRSGSRSRRRSQMVTAILLPLALILGFCLLLFVVFGDRLRPRIPVSVSNVLLLELPEGIAPPESPVAGRTLAQASGWIEADPYLIRVPAKSGGFVEQIHVLEGQYVTNGQLVATLDPSDREFELAEKRALADAERRAVEALQADYRVSALGVSQAVVRVSSLQASLDEAADRLQRLRSLTSFDVSAIEVTAAERQVATLTADLDSATFEVPRAEARVVGLDAERQRVAHRAEALEAETAFAELQLSRTRVFAPSEGVVLKRHAEPGRELGMKDDNSTVLTLFNPTQLQVRVDVPLSDIAHVNVGQTAHIVTSAFPGQTFVGTVTRIVGQADITRNTLQLKVAINAPHERMRPEMLCRVEFLEMAATADHANTGGAPGLWVAEAALSKRSGTDAQVWVVDPVASTVSPQDIQIGTQAEDGLVLVSAGLNAGTKVVTGNTSHLRPGALVRILGETP